MQFCLSSCVWLSFICSGVPQGEGEETTPRHSPQRSDASHRHPAALVPHLSDQVTLPAEKRCHHDYTGTIYIYLINCLSLSHHGVGVDGSDPS